MNSFFQFLIEGRAPKKADFRLPSAEGNWGYPEDLLAPAHNGGGHAEKQGTGSQPVGRAGGSSPE